MSHGDLGKSFRRGRERVSGCSQLKVLICMLNSYGLVISVTLPFVACVNMGMISVTVGWMQESFGPQGKTLDLLRAIEGCSREIIVTVGSPSRLKRTVAAGERRCLHAH